MPRLFTGLKIPSEIGVQLALLQSGLAGVRWIDPTDFHITLRFIGDVERPLADDIEDALAHIISAPFSLELFSLGSFGGDRPRMVWAGVRPSEELSRLHQQHEILAQRLGLKAEGRKFTPHVTLARIKNGGARIKNGGDRMKNGRAGNRSSAAAIARYLSDNADFRSFKFDVSEFLLFSAKSSTGGGPYLIEANYPLDRHDDFYETEQNYIKT